MLHLPFQHVITETLISEYCFKPLCLHAAVQYCGDVLSLMATGKYSISYQYHSFTSPERDSGPRPQECLGHQSPVLCFANFEIPQELQKALDRMVQLSFEYSPKDPGRWRGTYVPTYPPSYLAT